MVHRISTWAGTGFFVAAFWAIYFFPTASAIIANQPAMWGLARITCPIVFASFYLHLAVPIYAALLANTVTYALIGLTFELLRKQIHQAG